MSSYSDSERSLHVCVTHNGNIVNLVFILPLIHGDVDVVCVFMNPAHKYDTIKMLNEDYLLHRFYCGSDASLQMPQGYELIINSNLSHR